MKKIYLVMFVTILLLFCMSVCSFADMGAPQIKSYKAVISNVNGVSKNDGSIIPYGTEINVHTEYKNLDNKVEIGFNYTENGKETYGNATLDDISLISEHPENDVDYSKKYNLVILKNEGVDITNGPAYIYEKIGTVPKGTKLTGYGIIDEDDSIWYYVDYNNIKGWVCKLDGAIGKENTNDFYKSIITPSEVTIYKDVYNYEENNTEIGSIPANTILENNLEIDAWSSAVYVTYQNVSGYVRKSDIAYKYSTNFTINYDSARLFKKAYVNDEYSITALEKNNSILKIPNGTIITSTYITDMYIYGWIYTTYNNESGWVFIYGDENADAEFLSMVNVEFENDLIDDAPIAVAEETMNPENTATPVPKSPSISIPSAYPDSSLIGPTSNNNANYELSGMQIVFLCIGVAAIAAVTTLVVILLVNKKSKK